MSYDIYLRDRVTKETVNFDTPHQMAGGTYAVGGTTEAWLNITYNYSQWYYKDGVFPDRGEKVRFSQWINRYPFNIWVIRRR